MFQRLLVPLDGSDGAERAIPVAARIARASGSDPSIVFLHVILPPPPRRTAAARAHDGFMTVEKEVNEKDLAEAASYLTAAISAYAEELTGITTEMDLAVGPVAPELFSTARLEHVDLIVMCSHGDTGLKRWVLGSVAQEAVRHSPVPVLVLNEHGTIPPAPDAAHPLRVLVPLDGSALAETALEPAAQLIRLLAAPAEGEMRLLRVVDLPSAYGSMKSQAHLTDSIQQEAHQEAETYLKAVADRLRAGPLAAASITVTTSVVVSTDVAGTLIKQAEQGVENAGTLSGGQVSCDLIAMATHGRGGLRRLVMGSVTEQLLGATRLPLLIVRPQEGEAQPEQGIDVSQVVDVEML